MRREHAPVLPPGNPPASPGVNGRRSKVTLRGAPATVNTPEGAVRVHPLLAGQKSPAYIRAVPTIALPADELAAVTAVDQGRSRGPPVPTRSAARSLTRGAGEARRGVKANPGQSSGKPEDKIPPRPPNPRTEGPAASQSRQARAVHQGARGQDLPRLQAGQAAARPLIMESRLSARYLTRQRS